MRELRAIQGLRKNASLKTVAEAVRIEADRAGLYRGDYNKAQRAKSWADRDSDYNSHSISLYNEMRGFEELAEHLERLATA